MEVFIGETERAKENRLSGLKEYNLNYVVHQDIGENVSPIIVYEPKKLDSISF